MADIFLNNIEKYYGANKVLEDITFQVTDGEKVGIVGRNGCGKTTLFKILAGLEPYDSGSINISKNSSVGYLEQIPNYSDEYRARDVLKLAFENEFRVQTELREIENEMGLASGKDLEIMMRKYGELQELFDNIGGYSMEEKVSKICTGLKLDEKFLNSKFNDLSGGEKTTVLLGKILLEEPDILLLDEPTNHLDMDSMNWLEEYLLGYTGIVVIVSHDRYFLDNVVDKIIEIEGGESNIFFGNYTYYIDEKEKIYFEDLKRYENQQKKIKSMEEAIKRMRDWATRADNEKMFKRVFNMEKRLERMDKVEKPKSDDDAMKLKFSAKDRSGQDVINIEDLCMEIGGKKLFNGLSHSFKYGDRVGIIGSNGSGKTTLLKVILEEMDADGGKIKLGSNVKVGYLQQNIHFSKEEGTIMEVFKEDYICTEGEARNILSRFLFYGEDVFKKVKSLSGGERARLRLCQLMHRDVNTLILDEPTNHLDILSCEMLEDTLLGFNGSIIFVSHDRYFINKIAEEVLELKAGRLKSYLGNYDYYREKKEQELRREETVFKAEEVKAKKETDYELNKRKNSLERSNLKKIKNLEEKIADYEKLIEVKDKEIEENATNYDSLSVLYEEKLQIEKSLSECMDEWLILSE